MAGRVPARAAQESEGRSQDWGSVSGQQGTPAFVGDGDGALLHQAPRPQAAPQCPLTQELEAFQVQGLVGRLLGTGWWPQSWGCWWTRQQWQL